MTAVTCCGARAGGSCFSRNAISVVVRFWCSWQMRQSLQPVLFVERFELGWLSTCGVAVDADGNMRP